MLKGRVGTIFALDPAGPGFDLVSAYDRINKNDAKYVEVTHTNWRCFGFKEPIGHTDFYVNGGYEQPGCAYWTGVNICDHQRGIHLLAESIKTGGFTGRICEYPIVRIPSNTGHCWDTPSYVKMGGEPSMLIRFMPVFDVFYFSTNSDFPYSQY